VGREKWRNTACGVLVLWGANVACALWFAVMVVFIVSMWLVVSGCGAGWLHSSTLLGGGSGEGWGLPDIEGVLFRAAQVHEVGAGEDLTLAGVSGPKCPIGGGGRPGGDGLEAIHVLFAGCVASGVETVRKVAFGVVLFHWFYVF